MVKEVSKRKAEVFFEKFTTQVIRYRLVVVVLVLAVSGIFIDQIKDLGVDMSSEGFLHDDDPVLETYYEFRDQFGRDDKIIIAIKSDSVFSLKFLKKLKALHQDLEENVPHVYDIISMLNARNTHGVGDTLRVDDLLADFPETEQELAELEAIVMSSPLYKNQLISEDGTLTSMVLESEVYSQKEEENLIEGFESIVAAGAEETPQTYLSDDEITKMVDTAETIARKYDSSDFRIYIAGTPTITQTVKKYMMEDMRRFMLLSALTIGISLFIMFRRISGVILPLLIVALTLISTLGLMAWTGIKFKAPTTILPSFLLAVGVGACVHALALTYLNLRRGLTRNEAIIGAYAHSGLAIVMTSLTTAAGLASFAIAKVAPIADLGLFSAIGIMIALIYTFTVLPAILSYLPLKEKITGTEDSTKVTMLDRFLNWVSAFSVHHYRYILAVSSVLIVFGIMGLFKVYFSHDVLKWLPENFAVRQATEIINKGLRGSVVLEIVLDTGLENGLYDQKTLVSIDTLAQELETDYKDNQLFIGKVMSLTEILKEIHQALHENDPQFYKIPEDGKLIPQELLLFENSGSDDLEDVIDSRFRVARITLKVPWLDSLMYTPFIHDVEKRFAREFGNRKLEGGEMMTVVTTGITTLLSNASHASIYSAALSYGIAVVVITLLMIILIGEIRLGLISMIPNLGPIILVLGMIGWLSIPLNMFTMLVASIAIGLSVDNTIHFMYNFSKYYEKTGSIEEGVNRALNTAGRALLTTTVVLSFGFFIFMFASMRNLFEFGLFTGIAIILALASNFIMAPALLTLIFGKKQKSTHS